MVTLVTAFTVLLLSHWGLVTHICVGKLIIITSVNALSPRRDQSIIRTNVGILLIGLLGTHVSENLNRNSYIFVQEKASEYVVWKMADFLSRSQRV